MRQECCPVADGVAIHKELVSAVGEGSKENSQNITSLRRSSEKKSANLLHKTDDSHTI